MACTKAPKHNALCSQPLGVTAAARKAHPSRNVVGPRLLADTYTGPPVSPTGHLFWDL